MANGRPLKLNTSNTAVFYKNILLVLDESVLCVVVVRTVIPITRNNIIVILWRSAAAFLRNPACRLFEKTRVYIGIRGKIVYLGRHCYETTGTMVGGRES